VSFMAGTASLLSPVSYIRPGTHHRRPLSGGLKGVLLSAPPPARPRRPWGTRGRGPRSGPPTAAGWRRAAAR
jgi:hypothetical protein